MEYLCVRCTFGLLKMVFVRTVKFEIDRIHSGIKNRCQSSHWIRASSSGFDFLTEARSFAASHTACCPVGTGRN
jgi:hypothetical protein